MSEMWSSIRCFCYCLTGALVLICLMASITIHSTIVTKAFIENGYSRDTVKGDSITQWVKKGEVK